MAVLDLVCCTFAFSLLSALRHITQIYYLPMTTATAIDSQRDHQPKHTASLNDPLT